ncbi:hypothetical protein [Undibacterium sp. YM2]|uniref:hypothetical protein n=1 Tax=Undibacterium sp. YM2 TaxID=2058625 RepID=UPI001389634C|nr:hypothetical protein [Undibacterium sp. YM2]
MLKTHISTLHYLLCKLLDSTITEQKFHSEFGHALSKYAKYINDRPYYPLNDLTSMSGEKLRKYASDALARLPREELDRSTRKWIEDNLVDEDAFSFHDKDGQPKFGQILQLYHTEIEKESFLLSALNGTIQQPTFKYADLLAVLKEQSSNELGAWVLCNEPDNAFANIEYLWTLGEVYEEPEQLAKIERIRGDSVQWGDCFLMLLPKSKNWLLLNTYRFSSFEISLHAKAEFVDAVLSDARLFNSMPARVRRGD